MLTPPDYVRAVAFLAHGRPVWSVTEPEARGRPASSQLKVLNEAGKTTIALTVEGVVDHIGVEPGDARGLYFRLYESVLLPRAIFPQPERIAYVSLGDRGSQAIAGLLSRPAQLTHEVEDRGAGARVYTAQLSNPFPRPAFGVGKGAVYLGDKGSLWRVDTATGTRKKVEFSADIAFEFFPGSPPPTYSETRAASPTSILTPRLAPDGKSVIFTAAGFVWRQALAGGAAQRLLDSTGFEWGPAALSPDGKRLAYQLSEDNYQELRVVDLASGHDSSLVREYRNWRYEPLWSPDGTKLVYTRVVPAPNPLTPAVPNIYLADLASGETRTVATGNDRWQPAPQFSRDGKNLYFTSEGQLHRCSIDNPRDCEPITALRGFVDNGQVSPDGRWLAFRRNDEIWVAPRNTGIVKEDAAYRFSASGGRNFSFTPDGTSLVYSVGAEVWLQPLGHDNKSPDKKTKVGVQIRLSAESPPPVLLRNIRVLDFNAGGFTEPTALMVEDGRIKWIGNEASHPVPQNATVLDGGGRFAIPGLFDMHTHTATLHPQTARDVSWMDLWIAYGVTSVADMGSDIGTLKAWSDRRTGFGAPVPRVFSFGSMIESTPFIWPGDVYGVSDEQIRNIVRLEKEEGGATGVKSYFTLTWPLHRAVSAEARLQGLPVRAHGMIREEVIREALLGVAGVEHMLPTNMYYDDILQLLAKAGIHWTPTLSIVFGLLPEGSPVRTMMMEEVKRAYQAGVPLLPGTDSFNHNDWYGLALNAELQHFVQAGIPPIEVLRMATQRSAAFVGAESVLGSLEPGKLADLVVLDANPLDDIANTLKPWRVIAGGRVFSEPQPLYINDEEVHDPDDIH
jgi:imidazolonepropionase-like amidohydrolase/Tol biopolymer transport system component